MQQDDKKSRERIAKMREIAQVKPSNNKNSVAYNPVTLSYNNTPDGHALQREHNRVLYRAALRSKVATLTTITIVFTD